MNKILTNKIKQIILEDRQTGLLAFEQSLKSDLFSVLNGYLTDIADISLSISADDFAVRLDITIIGNGLQKVGSIL